MKILKIIFICIAFAAFFSCTPEKKFVYLQKKDDKTFSDSSAKAKKVDYKIKSNDFLYIKIASIDQNSNALNLNVSSSSSSTTNGSSDMGGLYFDSYYVNDSGYVSLPLLGKIHVKDSTVEQCQSSIQKLVDVYLKNSLVIVRLANFKVTILGEVNKPGTFMVYNSHINILDAIGLAGDLTINGSRKEIMLIRHNTPDKIVYLDLTDINLIHSDYYYLSPEDIIYIKPLRAKYFGTNPFPFATVFSVISTLLLLIDFFHK